MLKLPWLFDGSTHNVSPYSFYCSILIMCIVFIASVKIPERKGSISPSSFYGQLHTISHKCWPYLPSRWVPFFVSAVPSLRPIQHRAGWRNILWCGVFVDDKADVGWFLLGFDATLDAGCGFREHLQSLREVNGLQHCSKTLKMVI